MSLKVMTIIGTRPEIIKLSRVMYELDRHVQHVLVHTGQNHDYELNEIFFKELEIRKPDYFLNSVGDTLAETIGNIIVHSDRVIEQEKPDALLILGDTNSSLSVISAKRRKIPIFHMEAGNRCFDQRVPEEINRKIVDHTSDINITFSEHARSYLMLEGIKPETIIKTGSPVKEVIDYYYPKIVESKILEELDLQENQYFVVSVHREENVDSEENLENIMSSLNAIATKYERKIIFSTHPRTKKRLEHVRKNLFNEKIIHLKPFGFLDYIKLQMNALCVISDSGTITEEASILNIPAITIRQAHERPEGMDEGVLIMSGLKPEVVLQSIEVILSQYKKDSRTFRLVKDYDVDTVSKKVLRIILSYTEYVNRTVWFKKSR